MVGTCKARERVHGPFVPRSSTPLPSTSAVAGSSFTSEQLVNLSAYLAQNLGLSVGSSSSNAAALSAAPRPLSPWIFDSGVTHHMTPDRHVISQPSSPARPNCVYTANGSRLL